MWVARVDEGWLFGDLSPRTAEILRGVPMLLESEDPRVRARLIGGLVDQQLSRGRLVDGRERELLPVGQGRGGGRQHDGTRAAQGLRDQGDHRHRRAWR